MPLGFLIQAERQRYQVLPTAIAGRDLRQCSHLSKAGRARMATFRGSTSWLDVAPHLGLLRYLGYLSDAWLMHVSAELRTFVAEQLPIGPLVNLAGYDSRETTRTAHLRAALEHLGWSKWTPINKAN